MFLTAYLYQHFDRKDCFEENLENLFYNEAAIRPTFFTDKKSSRVKKKFLTAKREYNRGGSELVSTILSAVITLAKHPFTAHDHHETDF